MFCKKCGAEISPKSKFCTNCGEKVSHNSQENSFKQNNIVNDDIYYEDDRHYQSKKSNSGMYAIIAVVAVLAAIIAGVAGYMIMNHRNVQTENNNTETSQTSEDTSQKTNNESSDSKNVSDDAKTAKNSVPKSTFVNDEDVTQHREIKHTYKVIKMNVTWEEAEAYCEKQGGHLATITSAEEADKITSLINATDAKVIWLGANDLNSDGKYKWITGEDFTYSNWAPGEPNNDGGIEHYLVVYKVNGEWVWNDGPIDTNKSYDPNYIGFVCEWDE